MSNPPAAGPVLALPGPAARRAPRALAAAWFAALALGSCGGEPSGGTPAAGGSAAASASGAAVDVATDATYPPFESVDEQSKQIVGFDIDLIKAVGERAGLRLNIANSGFDSLLAGIGSCQYDAAISSITITPERQASMRFSEPYFQASQRIAARSDDSSIAKREDLSGKRVGAQIGTTGALEVGKIAGAELKTYDELNQAFQDLLNRQIDAVIADNVPVLGYIAKNADRLRATEDVFGSEFYGIAVCPQQTELVGKIDAALAALRADGTLAALQQRWGLGGAGEAGAAQPR